TDPAGHPDLRERYVAAFQAQQRGKIVPGEVREYAHRNVSGVDTAPTLLWHPQLRIAAGKAEAVFEVPGSPAPYRAIVWVHDE
ncbi:MAG: hypothetical protein NZO58_10070, partial [Gemmataceae bacterium]|nr:hypothetical protein [Gemmataceae bacterium]